MFRKTKMNLMTQEQIEKSKVIAEFMGMDIDNYPSNIPKWVEVWGNPFNDQNIAKYEYHSSYDWLMPVAKKLVEGYPHGKKFFDKQREYE